MLKSKKGLSPLIAAVLLIVVVVGIGAVVTGIVRSFVSENQQTIKSKNTEMACSRDVDIDFIKLDGVQQVCKGSNYITAILENVGSGTVDDFEIKMFTVTGIWRNESVSAADPFEPGEAQEFNTTFSGFTDADIEQVQFVPKLKKGGANYVFCTDVALKVENILDC